MTGTTGMYELYCVLFGLDNLLLVWIHETWHLFIHAVSYESAHLNCCIIMCMTGPSFVESNGKEVI
jgi:hypothetical protein